MADVIEFLKKQAAKETYWSRNENAYMLLKAADLIETQAKEIEEMRKPQLPHAVYSCIQKAEKTELDAIKSRMAFRKLVWMPSHGEPVEIRAYTPLHNSAWVDANDRVPPEGKRVIVKLRDIVGTLDMDTDRIFHGKWVRWRGNVTHWMELPEPPKEG